MKKSFFVLFVLVIIKLNVNAQSAIAIFKPLYGGDEHYGFATASTEDDAKDKALDALKAVVDEKVGSGTAGRSFVYKTTGNKGYYVIGRGKDQYGHYWHYEAIMGADDELAAKNTLLSRLSGRGLSDAEIMDSGLDQ